MSEESGTNVPTDVEEGTGSSLPPQPTPVVEPQAPPPGGPNAIEGVGGDGAYTRQARDLSPLRNPSADEIPPETMSGEDTDTEATKGNPEVAPTEESPA